MANSRSSSSVLWRLGLPAFLLLPVFCDASVWLQQRYAKSADTAEMRTEFVLTEGAFPEGKPQALPGSAAYYLRDMEGHVSERNISGAVVPFAPPYKGNYHLFVEARHVEAGVLHVLLTKTRAYNMHGDLATALASEIRGKTVGSYYGKPPLPEIPFEIVMQRPIKHHHINCCIYSGDIARFKIYFRQEAQQNIPLTVITQTGWRNRFLPDDTGMIAFEVPRNSYADIHTDKRHKEWMLVEAEYTETASGIYNGVPYTGVRYTMSIPLSFHSSPLEYTSELPGFFTVVGVMLVFSLGAYYHRRRKRKTPTEIWFDDDA